MKLTKSEWDIVNHRLGVPDAIADAISDSDDAKFTWQEVYSEAHMLQRLCAEEMRHRGNIEMTPETATPLQRAILLDCIEGSTYFAGRSDAEASGEITKGQGLAMCRAAHSLIKKFKQAGLTPAYLPPEWP